MPYISLEERESYDFTTPRSVGELNYGVTLLCKNYLDRNGLKYSTLNDILGALTGAQLEFYRRVAETYEDKKIIANGDIY